MDRARLYIRLFAGQFAKKNRSALGLRHQYESLSSLDSLLTSLSKVFEGNIQQSPWTQWLISEQETAENEDATLKARSLPQWEACMDAVDYLRGPAVT